jgi:hypothetical protein
MFIQMLAYEVARGGFLDHHVRELRVIYRERRDAMLVALDHYFPPETTWNEPQGGLFMGHAASGPRRHRGVTGSAGRPCGVCSWHRLLCPWCRTTHAASQFYVYGTRQD